jgi:hypothetical protein
MRAVPNCERSAAGTLNRSRVPFSYLTTGCKRSSTAAALASMSQAGGPRRAAGLFHSLPWTQGRSRPVPAGAP